MRYLAGKHDKKQRQNDPKDPKLRALASQWMDWQLSVVGPAIFAAFWGLIRTPPEKRDMAAIKTSQEKTTAAMQIMDAQLAKTKFLAGDTFSYGDIPVGIMCYRFVQLVPDRPASMPNPRSLVCADFQPQGIPGSRRQRAAVLNSTEQEGRCLGLIGGLGTGATVHYYRELVVAHEKLARIPRLLIAHADVQRVYAAVTAKDFDGLARYLAGLVTQLAAGGAEVTAIVAATPHICADQLLSLSPLPLVNMLTEVASAVR